MRTCGEFLLINWIPEDVWNRVEGMLANYLKNNNINVDAANLTDKLEWSVKVRLKK